MGSDSPQGAGAPTMFQAMRRIVSCLAQEYIGEGDLERAIRQSFLGMGQWTLFTVLLTGLLVLLPII